MRGESPNSAALPPEASAALSNGNKIEAIKIVRETWDISLKEAKEAVERGGLYGVQPPKLNRRVEIPPEAMQPLMRGELIEAIRIVRTSQRVDLKDAKEAVDAYLEKQPALAQAVREAQAETRRRVLGWLTAILTSMVLLYYLFVGE